MNKRTLLKAAAAAGACTFSGVIPGLRAWAATPLRVRRCVNTMKDGDADLECYRDFVGIMLARPQADAVSWLGFANQHGDEKDFRFCPHGDWYFLPWHREFVMMYERAAASLTKNPAFAMPYWDWTTLRDYPKPFAARTYKGKPNPLHVDTRNALKGENALTDRVVGQRVMDKIYRETVYEAFGTSRDPDQKDTSPSWVPAGGGVQGALESTPHNLVHNRIGGFMPESNSPRDPIFFMHHGNIDRIWATWNAMGRTNSDDPLWLGMEFKDNYIAPDGSTYSRSVKDVLDTAPLGYTYDRMPKRSPPLLKATTRDANMRALFDPRATAKPQRTRKANAAAASPEAPLAVPFSLPQPRLGAAPSGPTAAREVVAIISDIQMGENVQEIHVLLDHPAPSLKVPETDPHFVARIGFLRHSSKDAGHDHKALPSAIVDLTDTLRNLGASGKAADQITVQLVPVPKPGAAAAEAAKVVPAAVEIAIL
jgi:tyrosinase